MAAFFQAVGDPTGPSELDLQTLNTHVESSLTKNLGLASSQFLDILYPWIGSIKGHYRLVRQGRRGSCGTLVIHKRNQQAECPIGWKKIPELVSSQITVILYPMIGSIKGNQQIEWKRMSYGAWYISGVASYEFRNVREGLIISVVWRLWYIPAGRRGQRPKDTPSNPTPSPHPSPTTAQPHPPPRLVPPCRKVLHWSFYIGPWNQKSYNCVESHKKYRICTHARFE